MRNVGYFNSPIGVIKIIVEEERLVSLELNKKDEEETNNETIDKTKEWLKKYFRKEKPNIEEINICPKGTTFQKKVWSLLLEIPYGKTISYGEIAKKIGPNMSAQAVGGAVHCNPIPFIIPCHRVIGSKKNLVGYAYGLEMKRFLLDLEKNNDLNNTGFGK